jgi:hypothetical protein
MGIGDWGFEVTKLFDKVIVFKEVHPRNILFVLFTDEVTNLDKSKDINELHP